MKLGQKVTENEVISEFARIVERSGGNKASEKMKYTKSIRATWQQAATWFQDGKVLSLCNDIRPIPSSRKGIMAELRDLSAAPVYVWPLPLGINTLCDVQLKSRHAWTLFHPGTVFRTKRVVDLHYLLYHRL